MGPEAYSSPKARSRFSLEKLKKTYLFIYNSWQFLGFLYIMSTLAVKYYHDGEGNREAGNLIENPSE